MRSQTYLQLLASQLLVGGSSAWLFAWSRDENAAVLPRQTNAVKNHLDGRSPAPEPTSPPLALREPRRDSRVLKRAGDTCGYRNGNKALPLECGNGLYCFNDPAISMIDCCSSANVQDCTAAVTCLDRTQSDLWTAGSNTWLCDDQEFPACVTLRYGPGSYSGYTWIACGRTADDFGTAFYKTTDIIFTSSVDPFTVPDPITVTITPTTKPTPTPPTSSSSSTTPTPPPTSPAAASSSVPIGPIVGGAVGGVAVLALLGFGIFFLVFKKRRQDQPQPQPAVSGVSQFPPPAGSVAQTPTPGLGGGPSPSPPVSGLAVNAGDIKTAGGYFQPNNNNNYTYGGTSPPMSPVPPYSTSPPPPMQGAVSPMSMSAAGMTTNSQFSVPSQQQSPQPQPPQMGLGVAGVQGMTQGPPPQQQQYYQPQQQQQTQQQATQGYTYQYGQAQAAELDTARGDGEVRELP